MPTKPEREPHDRVTLNLPDRLVRQVDEHARAFFRSRSGMVSWLLQRQLGMVGDADKPEDIQEDIQEDAT